MLTSPRIAGVSILISARFQIIKRFTLFLLLAFFSIGSVETAASGKKVTYVPYRDAWSGAVISLQLLEDGSQDVVIAGTGFARTGGPISVLLSVHVENYYYEPLTHSLIFPFQGSNIDTFSNGDFFNDQFQGASIVPLDAFGQPLPPPYAVFGQFSIVGGTGRFLHATGSGFFTGLDFGDGRYSFQDFGVISTPRR